VELLRLTSAGDRAAFGELFDRNSSCVLGLLLRMLRQRAEAEEVLQEVFLQVWREADRYRPEKSAPRSWLLLMARSRALDRLRSRQARQRREEEVVQSAWLDGQPVAVPTVLGQLEAEERRGRVAAALGRLPAEQRQAVELAFFEGLTHRLVAERLQQPLGTVKSRILLGLKRLRRELAGPDDVEAPGHAG
jgi:RNA polymerase sigma-70 factor, ECF subfamily